MFFYIVFFFFIIVSLTQWFLGLCHRITMAHLGLHPMNYRSGTEGLDRAYSSTEPDFESLFAFFFLPEWDVRCLLLCGFNVSSGSFIHMVLRVTELHIPERYN